MKNIRVVIVLAIVLVGILLVTIIGLFVQNQTNPDVQGTGGSGEPSKGTVIIQNMDASSTDNVPFSRFVSIKQNQLIHDSLKEVLLAESKQYAEYNAAIVDGSVVVDYDTNIVTFVVRVQENNTSYKGTLNTMNDVVHFYSPTTDKQLL